MIPCRHWLIFSWGTWEKMTAADSVEEKPPCNILCQVAASGFDLGPVFLETWWSVKSTGRHFKLKKKKLCIKGKGDQERLIFVRFIAKKKKKGKAIGSKEIPKGNFLQQQQIRNRMDQEAYFSSWKISLQTWSRFWNDRQMPRKCKIKKSW